ncbi:helix-turn-helix transcriptional regulator [Caloramator sp. E03]|uniref:helix-turn-helix transcriptional regulator n=1 Tax=Caloramator sp. E03 TaxID=2576307 RepID=UPI00143D66D2|nr:helix-turn-helix transcriptional regulator [Caloramator sp. E03]
MKKVLAKPNNLQVIRIKKGFTYRALGKKAGISYLSIIRAEEGKNIFPKTAKAIAEALEVDFDEIFKIV